MDAPLDDETREIIISFIEEGYERLDDAESQLSTLDDGGDRTPKLNSVFRLFHSVKGSAGYLGFDHIKGLTHEAETLLDVFLKERVDPTPESIDIVFETVDILRKLIGIVEKNWTDADGENVASGQAKAIARAIEALRAPGTAGNAGVPPASGSVTAAAGPEDPGEAGAPVTDAVDTGAAGVPNSIRLTSLVTRDMVERFIGECADTVDATERIVLGLEAGKAETDHINDIFRAIHTIKGNSGFFGYLLLESTCMEMEGTLDEARKKSIPVSEAFSNALIKFIDRLRAILSSAVILEGEEEGDEGPERYVPPDAGRASPARAATEAQAEAHEAYKSLGEILVGMGAVNDEQVSAALKEQERPIGEILVEKGVVDKTVVDSALREQQAQAAVGEPEAVREVVRREIRVDTAKLDKLFDLVGELITAEAMVLNSPDLAGLKLDGFSKSFARLNKISRELQETTMMIRMIPLDGLFQKMRRLVRDLSRKFDKPIDFEVSGQDTEMDKNVIEQVADPLVHILRNAIDHGVESRDVRAGKGKAETGSVRLNAKYEGSDIWITVKDDGAGLDRERILAKAAERGLLKGDPGSMTDSEVWQYIFEPGFSTASVVSEVSGRGVGLDVVKKNLERIHGRIDIRTVPGAGTEFVLVIPLTMAIIDGITVRVGNNRYSIPLGDIIEFVKVTESQLTTTDTAGDTVNIRNEFLPLIKLWETFRVGGAGRDPTKGIVIIAQNNGRKACILIDEVIGNQQIVVKSLSEYLGKVDGISGCSILGDGSVSFIIDTGRLLSMKIE